MAISDSAPGLKERRVALYLTRRELAERAGVTMRTIYNIESERHAPTSITLRRIEDVLNAAESATRDKIAGGEAT